jgi:cullin 3
MEESGLVAMIRNEKYHELALLYELFSRVPETLQALSKHLAAYVEAEGGKLTSDDKLKPDEFVGAVISLREKMVNMQARSFNRDSHLDLTVKAAFERFLNEGTSGNGSGGDKTAMSLVYYLDDQFKREFKGLPEAEVAERLDRVIKIFRYLQDKDVFEGFYKNSLSKRLLDQRLAPGAAVTHEDAEKLLVLKLKEECGFQYTQKLEVMFKDIKMSDDTVREYNQTSFSKQH